MRSDPRAEGEVGATLWGMGAARGRREVGAMPSTSLHRLAIAPVLAAATLAGAAPASADPTLRVDRPCYAPGDTIAIEGEGYSPNAPVDVSFTAAAVATNVFTTDVSGLLRVQVDVGHGDADALIAGDRTQQEVTLAAVDRTIAAANDGRPAGAATTFLLSQARTYTNRDLETLRASRSLRLMTVGWTLDVR